MKIYRNRNNMLALVDADGHGIWVHSGYRILSKIDLSDGWVEQRAVDVDEPEPEVVEVRSWGGDVVIEIVLSSDHGVKETLRLFTEYEDIGPGDGGEGYVVERIAARPA